MDALSSDHITGDFAKLIDRATLLLLHDSSFEETCLRLAEDVDRETAFFACVAALGELKPGKIYLVHPEP